MPMDCTSFLFVFVLFVSFLLMNLSYTLIPDLSSGFLIICNLFLNCLYFLCFLIFFEKLTSLVKSFIVFSLPGVPQAETLMRTPNT